MRRLSKDSQLEMTTNLTGALSNCIHSKLPYCRETLPTLL